MNEERGKIVIINYEDSTIDDDDIVYLKSIPPHYENDVEKLEE